MDTPTLFETGIAWLRDNYSKYRFYQEYETAWLVRCHILDLIAERRLPYITMHNHQIIPCCQTDLAIIDTAASIPIVVEAAEWKYEPDHAREKEYRPTQIKEGVTDWSGIAKDVVRVRKYVDEGGAQVAHTIFIDEGGGLPQEAPHASQWQRMGLMGVPNDIYWARIHPVVAMAVA